jgi:hypothetical protein
MSNIGVMVSSLGTVSNELSSMSSKLERLREISRSIEALEGKMPSGNSVSEISAQLRTVAQTLLALDRLESQLGRDSDSAGTATLFGRLASIEGGVAAATDKSSDAAKKAAGAKNEAANAVNDIRALKQSLIRGSGEESLALKVEQVRDSIRRMQKSLGDISPAKELETLYGTVKGMAASIDEFSKTQGYKWLKEMKEPPKPGAEGKGGVVAEKGGVEELNASIIEIRSRLQFLQKMIEEMRDKPVVEESLIGG